MRTGDFVLTCSDDLPARAIAWGQRLRRVDPHYVWPNHAALVIRDDGWLLEATTAGLVRTHLDAYREFTHVPLSLYPRDRAQLARFARAVARARPRLGWGTRLAVLLAGVSGGRLVLGPVGTAISSGFVAEALVRAGFVFARPPHQMQPCDLAAHFEVDRV